MTFTPEGHYEISEAEKNSVSVSDTDISVSETRLLTLTPVREIAEAHVGVLLSEGIFEVTKGHIKVMNLTVPREKIIYFQIILNALRIDQPIKQAHGYTVTPVTVARGNDTFSGYKVESKVDKEGSIILTRKLASELSEVVPYFIPAQAETDYNKFVTGLDNDDDDE